MPHVASTELGGRCRAVDTFGCIDGKFGDRAALLSELLVVTPITGFSAILISYSIYRSRKTLAQIAGRAEMVHHGLLRSGTASPSASVARRGNCPILRRFMPVWGRALWRGVGLGSGLRRVA